MLCHKAPGAKRCIKTRVINVRAGGGAAGSLSTEHQTVH